MQTSFPPDVAEFMHDSVAAGVYASEADLLIAAVRQLRDSQENYARFRAELGQRLSQLDQGERIELEGDAELGRFLLEIENEVMEEISSRKP
jgi:Arc/MetJ-type ribon-helix-helix transcriptional regulator